MRGRRSIIHFVSIILVATGRTPLTNRMSADRLETGEKKIRKRERERNENKDISDFVGRNPIG